MESKTHIINMWKLNESNFTLKDKCKIAKFFFQKKDMWTMGDQVKTFERKMAKFASSKYAVFVANGSVANTLIAMYLKDKVYKPNKNIIVFPSTTWVTSVSPFIREGFTPEFIDINLDDWSIDLNSLEKFLKSKAEHVACIFITSLLGYTPNINKIKELSEKYKVKVMMDNCENTFGEFENKNVSSFFTSTTSTYFGHQLQSVEGGFVFTDCKDEYEYFLMARNHGMSRSVPDPKPFLNKNVDSRFDFHLLGNNFRNTNIHAFIGLLDFERISFYIEERIKIYKYYESKYQHADLLPKYFDDRLHVPFCIPIICKSKEERDKALEFCRYNHIETRPIISGNLLKQTCFQKYGDYKKYKNSEFLDQYAFYVGLHSKVNKNILDKLLKYLNNI